MTHPHDHDNPHDTLEQEHGPRPEYLLLEQAVRELLIEKGVIQAQDVQRQIEAMDARTPAQGARLVARFWSDAAFRKLALRDGKAAAEQMGIDMIAAPELVILENTPRLHHVVVCTLCSCYPRAVLGMPPSWYKSPAYRARVVREPRAVLREFGLELPETVEVRVVDSTADIRYLVVPLRPAGTEGLSEERLAALVGRDSMIGVALAAQP